MATFKISIFKHQQRQNGKYPVSIRLYWKKKIAYIKTEYYVTEKQINKKDFSVKDPYILSVLNERIVEYENIKSQKLGDRINLYDAKDLARYFKEYSTHGSDKTIDFVEFSRNHCEALKRKGRHGTANVLLSSLNQLIDFAGRERIPITDITSKYLYKFEEYLKSPRKITRINQFGRPVVVEHEGCSQNTVNSYLTKIRTLFNAAMYEYNDEDKGDYRIQHYPFKKFKFTQAPEPKKRSLTVEQIRILRDIPEEQLGLYRNVLARDVFMLSFYLVGINTADLYELKPEDLKEGRITYKRQKTRSRRADEALISIKIEPEALSVIEKCRDPKGKRLFRFANRYSNDRNFCSGMDKSLKKVAEVCGIDENLTTYYARHSWASIARNKCKVSKDDINECLNHVDNGLKMADVYIDKDWSVIDEANRKVIDYLMKKES